MIIEGVGLLVSNLSVHAMKLSFMFLDATPWLEESGDNRRFPLVEAVNIFTLSFMKLVSI